MSEEEDFSQAQNSPSFSQKISDYSTVDSPLLTSANPKRKLDRNLKKDSCIDFKMAN